MPTARRNQPHYRDRSHPLRQVLDYAKAGQQPTPDELAAIPGYTDDLAVRIKVDAAVKKIHTARDGGGKGGINNIDAGRQFEAALEGIGQQIAGRDMPPDTRPEPESVDDIAARMFGR